jgi:hypothetical protein
MPRSPAFLGLFPLLSGKGRRPDSVDRAAPITRRLPKLPEWTDRHAHLVAVAAFLGMLYYSWLGAYWWNSALPSVSDTRLVGSAIVNSLAGAAIPLAAYYGISWYSRRIGLIVALLLVASALPYMHPRTGSFVGLVHFAYFFSACLIANYFYRASNITLFAIAGVLFLLAIARPLGALIFWLFVFIALVAAIQARRPVRSLVIASIVYAALMLVFGVPK